VQEFIMAVLTIRNIDETVKTRLRVSAALKGVSMEEEARQVLTRAMENAANDANVADLATRIRARMRNAKIAGIELAITPREAAREPIDFGATTKTKKTTGTTRRRS
jgi:antitoxin FitA